MDSALPIDFVDSLQLGSREDMIAILERRSASSAGSHWIIHNEVKPVDFYCYLGGRFGQPNGFQTMIRKNDSDNLFHWDWFLKIPNGHVTIMGMSYRTEVMVSDSQAFGEAERLEFIAQIKRNFGQYGPEMASVRKTLEPWIEVINPYQRLRRSVYSLLAEFQSLGIPPGGEPLEITEWGGGGGSAEASWNEQGEKFHRAVGIAFGIRSMLPVMAEAFVNMLLYILMKEEIRKVQRLRDNTFRQPIDVRIQSLSHTCLGFNKSIDFSSEPCSRYHTLVNERNDLLHGNVVVEKLKFNDVFFDGKIPVFKEYSTMWHRSFGNLHFALALTKSGMS